MIADPYHFERSGLYIGQGTTMMSRSGMFRVPGGVALDLNNRVYNLPSFHDLLEGEIFLQNLPSIIAAHALDPQEGEKILDMCAAAGGETTAIAILMKDKGEIIAVDRSHNKVLDIQKLAAEMGLKCITTYLSLNGLDIQKLATNYRKVADRPRDPAKWGEIADVVAAVSIPVIANGDVFEYEDFERIEVATGASSVMVARGALWNASIFSPKGKSPWEDVKKEYVRKCVLWDNDLKSTKHTLKEMIMHESCLELPEGKAVIKSETLADLARLYEEDKYYEQINKNRPFLGGSM